MLLIGGVRDRRVIFVADRLERSLSSDETVESTSGASPSREARRQGKDVVALLCSIARSLFPDYGKWFR